MLLGACFITIYICIKTSENLNKYSTALIYLIFQVFPALLQILERQKLSEI